ncbi:putative quinol monooxygenase [Novosphingobium sp. PY1]|uniref:putative quinol monooxygenase n=1 Tax=Novosphingobium sp. PY1 TaxID=1882221 RepID=UPI000BE78037|nr:antibiotic biosynthesis monooxygenase family protein [Novosphingobium sp. PY1]BBA74071.1 antibiotic biosynthesis monooxygenase [Novosphingobium sp. PY1]GFM31308.1 antibiotic biosynthesis monooxygenase [Novosphingobium sp. PY1]
MAGKSFIARLRTKPEMRERMIELQAELKSLVFEHEPDALVYEFLQSQDDPDLFHVVATFRDEAAFDKHMHIDFHDRLVPGILECLAQDMELTFHTSLG